MNISMKMPLFFFITDVDKVCDTDSFHNVCVEQN